MRILTALMAMVASSTLFAQESQPPDPTTLVMPDMTPTQDPHVISDGWRHFYFHKAGVSYAQAYQDFQDCYRYLPTSNADNRLPMFVPWVEHGGVRQVQPTGSYGLVGSIIGGLVAGPLDRRDRQYRMRRCMEPRGYVRYPLAEDVWRQLIDDYSPRSIALQALAASRPAPALPQVTR